MRDVNLTIFGNALPLLRCPGCSHCINSVTRAMEGREPDSRMNFGGGFSVCAYCGVVLVFEESPAMIRPFSVRLATKAEIERASQSPMFRLVKEAAEHIQGERRRRKG